MSHCKTPYFIRKKQYECNNYRIPHVLYASFQKQLQNRGQKTLFFLPTYFSYKGTFLKLKSSGPAPTDTINWSQACTHSVSTLNCNIIFQ